MRTQRGATAQRSRATAAPTGIVEPGARRGSRAASQDPLTKQCRIALAWVDYQGEGGLLRAHLDLILSTVAEWRTIMATYGLNVTQMATLLGRNRATIGRWEKIADSAYLRVRTEIVALG
jgi:hypothetical protein